MVPIAGVVIVATPTKGSPEIVPATWMSGGNMQITVSLTRATFAIPEPDGASVIAVGPLVLSASVQTHTG
jgi:hypothetical protein